MSERKITNNLIALFTAAFVLAVYYTLAMVSHGAFTNTLNTIKDVACIYI